MTTITALNVRLGMDVSNFSDGANLAKGEVTKVASIMRQSVPPAEKYKQELDLLNRSFNEAGKQSAQYANAVEFLDKKHQQGKHSAEAVKKAQDDLARSTKAAADAAKAAKENQDRLAEAEKRHQAVMEKGKQLTQSVEKLQEAHNRRLREYSALVKSGAIDTETYRRAVERSNKTLKESQTAGNSAISSIKGMAAAYLSFQAITKSINLASQVEDATIAFEVLTGSAADGKLIFEQIRKFAAESPITFGGATEAAKTMMSFGVAAQDVRQNLQMLSDVTGGNNERFRTLALAFAQSSAAGRLMGQDLLQMVNAGFNPLQQISKTTGESLIELKKRMEDGGISADEVRKAFQDATAEGGMFNGMTARLAQTVSGKLNIALSDLEQKLAEAGMAMGPLLVQLLDTFTRLKPVLDAVVNLIDGISQGLGFAIAAITDLINSVTTFSVDTTEMNKFLDLLEQREREKTAAARENINQEFQQKQQAVDQAKVAERKAAEEAAKMRAKAMEEHRKAMEKVFKDQQANIEKERKARIKAIEDARKAQERAAQQAAEEFQKELENARKGAISFFEEQERKTKARREEVAKGPGGGMEVGSADAAKFSADVVNQSISKTAVPDEAIVTQRDIAKKTAELVLAQRQANAWQAIQIELAEMQLNEMKQNGFRRIR